MPESNPENPVVRAARRAARIKPPPQSGVDTNYSYIADILGVSRQVVQRYKKQGFFPEHHIGTLSERLGVDAPDLKP